MFEVLLAKMQRKFASSIWSGALSSPGLTKDMKEMIEEFLIPAGISPNLFKNNLTWLESNGMPITLEQHRISPTRSAKIFRRAVDRPTGYPIWFLAAFPDVADWASTVAEEASVFVNEVNSKEQLAAIDLKDSLYARYMTVYPGDLIEAPDGHLSSNYLKNLTEFYSKAMGRKYECSI
jgi:hypothetical protein